MPVPENRPRDLAGVIVQREPVIGRRAAVYVTPSTTIGVASRPRKVAVSSHAKPGPDTLSRLIESIGE